MSHSQFNAFFCSIGAAMEVEPLYAEPFLVGIRGNSQCFLIYEDPFELQDNWNVCVGVCGVCVWGGV